MIGVADFKRYPIKNGDSYLLYDYADLVAEFVSVPDILKLMKKETFSCRSGLDYPFSIQGDGELYHIYATDWYKGYDDKHRSIRFEDYTAKFDVSMADNTVEIRMKYRGFKHLICGAFCYMGVCILPTDMTVTVRHVFSYCNLVIVQVGFYVNGTYKDLDIEATLVFDFLDFRYLGCVLEHPDLGNGTFMLDEYVSCSCGTPLSAGLKAKLGLIGGVQL